MKTKLLTILLLGLLSSIVNAATNVQVDLTNGGHVTSPLSGNSVNFDAGQLLVAGVAVTGGGGGGGGNGTVTNISPGTTGLTTSGNGTGTITLAGIVVGANGGTGVSNNGKTFTIGGNVFFVGSNETTFTSGMANGTYLLPAINSTLSYALVSNDTVDNYNVAVTDRYVVLTTTSSNIGHNVNLPAASTFVAGETLVVADATGNLFSNTTGANYIKIVPNGSDTISGIASTNVQIANPFGFAVFICNGPGKWQLVNTGMVTSTSVAYGWDVESTNNYNVAIGYRAQAQGQGQVVIGSGQGATKATVGQGTSVAIGQTAIVDAATGTTGGGAVAIGDHAHTSSWRDTAIGGYARTIAVSGTSVGYAAFSLAAHGTAWGRGAWNMYSDSTVTGTSDIYLGNGQAGWFTDSMNQQPGANNILNQVGAARTIHGVDGSDWVAAVFFSDNSTVPVGSGAWAILTINGTGVPTAITLMNAGSGYTSGHIVANLLCAGTAPTFGYTLTTTTITGANVTGGSGFTHTTTTDNAGGPLDLYPGRSTGTAKGGAQRIYLTPDGVGSNNILNTAYLGVSFTPSASTSLPAVGFINGTLSVASTLATADTITVTTGNISMATAGKTLLIKTGSNAKAGTVTLTSGNATVTTTAITANSTVAYGLKTSSGTIDGKPFESAVVAGTSFNVTAGASDNSTYNYIIIDSQ